MSNYRVRQVLALGAMSDRQLRLLVALATWMNDDSLMVRVGFRALTEGMGTSADTARRARRDARTAGRISYLPGRGRGHLTLWTVSCLPLKGVQDAAPPCGDVKGVQEPSEKGGSTSDKRGAALRADQHEPERGLDLPAEPSSSLSRALDVIRGAAPDITEREARQIIANLKDNPRVRAPVPYLTAALANGDGAALVAEARDQIASQERISHASANGHAPARAGCASCGRAPRTGHTPGCPEDSQ